MISKLRSILRFNSWEKIWMVAHFAELNEDVLEIAGRGSFVDC